VADGHRRRARRAALRGPAHERLRAGRAGELFVVYNDERDTRLSGFPHLATRSFIVKVNRLIGF